MRTVLRRTISHSGLWLVTALLALATVFGATAEPKVRNRIEDAALRQMVSDAPSPVRDVSAAFNRVVLGRPPVAEEIRNGVIRALPPALASTLEASWGWTRTTAQPLDGPGITHEPGNLTPRVTIEYHTTVPAAVTMVEGTAPASKNDVVDVIVSKTVAEALAVHVGTDYTFMEVQAVRVVGVFEPMNAADPMWQSEPTALAPGIVSDARNQAVAVDPLLRRTGTLFTDPIGLRTLERNEQVWGMSSTVRIRFAADKMDAGQVPGIRAAVTDLRVSPRLSGYRLDTRLDRLLDDFIQQAAAMRAVFAVVVAGALGAALGLGALAARLAIDRRRTELGLVRARGAAVHRLARSLFAEALLVVVPAAVAGWAVHRLVPGREAAGVVFGVGWLPLALAVAVAAAVPLAGALAHRRAGVHHERRDLALARPTLIRRTLEVFAVAVAALGVLLLHRRGLSTQGIDPYLSAVPLLIGVAAGLLALRLYPLPVRLLGRMAVRRRGAAAFLGLARAGRVGSAATLPLVVLVLAVATGSFAGAVRTGVNGARDVAAAREVGGDLRLAAQDTGFRPDEAAALATVPGVTSVARVYRAPLGTLRRQGFAEPDVLVVALDAAAYRRALAAIGLDSPLPADLERAVGATEPLPALASGQLAIRLDDTLTVRYGDTDRKLRLAGTGEELFGLRRGADELLVVPWTPDAPVNELVVAGAGVDQARLVAAAEAATPSGKVTLTSLAAQRQALEQHAFNDGITVAFTIGTAAGLIAALLAVALALVVDAPARGRALSLLRTMGLSMRQARVVLFVELVPLVAAAVLTGAAVGAALPILLAPALGLTAFTAGVPIAYQFEPTTAGVLAGLCAALVIAGVLTEAAANRRLGLGAVLRV